MIKLLGINENELIQLIEKHFDINNNLNYSVKIDTITESNVIKDVINIDFLGHPEQTLSFPEIYPIINKEYNVEIISYDHMYIEQIGEIFSFYIK